MKKVALLKKSLVASIILLFICASFVSSIGGYSEETNQVDTKVGDACESQENVLVSCRIFGMPGEPSQEIAMPLDEAEFLYDKIKDLQIETARDPLSDKTQQLQHEIITLADEYLLLPPGVTAETFTSRLTPSRLPQHPKIASLPSSQNRASRFFCNYVSTGTGSALPVVIFPRLIPILLTPIPRLFVIWNVHEGVTSCGGLLSGTGFIAYGQQRGLALGFWGIGFSIFLPPVMTYGIFGYALFVTVTAENFEYYPPNYPPVISDENPTSGTWDVSLSLSELRFRIEDSDGDLMSYSVTTDPDVGSGSGNSESNGFYSVPVSGLEPDKTYRWTVEVSDGKDTTEKNFSFITEAGPPFDPFDEGWQYRKNITINHTKVTGNLTNFPVLVSTVDSDLRDHAQDDGDDILFMDDTGVATKLYHEIERYDDSSGELVAWVNVPSLSSTVDTSLYVYYGNSGCSSQQVTEKVWDSNYVMVQHMDGASAVTIDDSTSNNNDVTGEIGNPQYQQPGMFGYGIDFDGDGDRLGIPADASFNMNDDLTMEAWFKLNEKTSVGSHDFIYKKWCWIFNYRYGVLGFGGYTEAGSYYGTTILEADIWYYGVTIRNNPNTIFYVNGTFDNASSGGGNMNTFNQAVYIGGSAAGGAYLNSIIDEIRISNIARSSEWINTSYVNQNDPSSFLSFGSEETGS